MRQARGIIIQREYPLLVTIMQCFREAKKRSRGLKNMKRAAANCSPFYHNDFACDRVMGSNRGTLEGYIKPKLPV